MLPVCRAIDEALLSSRHSNDFASAPLRHKNAASANNRNPATNANKIVPRYGVMLASNLSPNVNSSSMTSSSTTGSPERRELVFLFLFFLFFNAFWFIARLMLDQSMIASDLEKLVRWKTQQSPTQARYQLDSIGVLYLYGQ